MADATPQLKRKRESAIGSQKKSKKQRQSEASAGLDAGAIEDIIDATPVVEPAPETQATRKPIDKSKPRSRKPQPNGVPADAPATAAPNLKPETQPNGIPDKADDSRALLDTPLKQGKKQRKQEQKDNKNAEQANSVDAPEDDAAPQSTAAQSKPQEKDVDKVAKKKAKKERKAEAKAIIKAQTSDVSKSQTSGSTKAKKQNKVPTSWTASAPHGGWFLPQDPIFTSDEKYLILATPKSVQIYSTETSLLARALPLGSTNNIITTFALSSTKPKQLYVADSSELITLWDWTEGTKLGRWQIGATVKKMVVITRPGADDDLVYCHEAGKNHVVNVHALRTKSQAGETELKQVLKSSSKITTMQVLLQGKYVVVSTIDTITVGKRIKASKTAVQDFSYLWREIRLSKQITTCSTYFRQPEVSEKGKKTAQDQRDVLDIAVGDESGVILLFEDILASFATIESSQKGNKSGSDSAESLRPKRFHWHRDAVGAVKWSLDGNYFISGGDETVLTIWQLATGQKQHLPHLTAAIENIVVSPTSYALCLANNSVIVLSTTELEARTNIIGIQTRRVDKQQLVKSKSGGFPMHALQPVPIAIDPKNAQQVLFAVPSSQPRHKFDGVCAAPYLQTFDIANQRPVSRQALTRNNATDPNMGPDGKRIIEPNVHILQVSHDGQYLATVDVWLPPKADLRYLSEGESDNHEEERLRRREVYLKIWRRDEKNGQWVLETRIDAPHFLEDASSVVNVVDLVANPKEHGFATIGEDHVVRIWKPKTRLRDGLVVRGAGDRGMVNWSLHRSVELPKPGKLWLTETSASPQIVRTSRLAFSADGSVLAAGVSGSSDLDRGLIHLIGTNSATIHRSMTEIDTTVLCGLGIVGRYLVAVTDCINVWDMVYDDLVYCAPINTAGVDQVERTSIVRLAANEIDGTFAVSLPQLEKYEGQSSWIQKTTSKILVYSTAQKEPLSSHTIPGITLGLVARQGQMGYVALDSVSCLRTISPSTGAVKLPTPQPTEQMEVQQIKDVTEDDREDTASKALQLEDVVLENDYDKPNVTQQDFEEIFHNGNAPQAPKDVFSAVLRLFGGAAKAAA
ncbi:WD40 repeat-like protein [Ophiobolus disseminans]|uniref:WD40 repeat-like protein n=1 Tax=Ophiobolus disseminans TaxID=1469910 RepID=A0A6A7A5E7_9PLEO|nr:WD40 repeat-like protein [Ophiobolus disseminans]